MTKNYIGEENKRERREGLSLETNERKKDIESPSSVDTKVTTNNLVSVGPAPKVLMMTLLNGTTPPLVVLQYVCLLIFE